jgi:hypothetical protein
VAQPAGYSRQGRLRGLLPTVSLHPAQPARAGFASLARAGWAGRLRRDARS